jgi:iron complex outermembrane recepter protein
MLPSAPYSKPTFTLILECANLTPRIIPGLRFNLDMWHIEKIDAIRTPNYAQILENEERFPDRVTRGDPLPGDPAGWAGPVVGFNTTVINISSIETKGYDAQVRYHYQTESWGGWTMSGNITYTDFIRTALTPTSPVTDTVGTRQGALQWRGRGSLFWESGSWRAGVSMRYIDSYVTETTAPSPQFPNASGLDGAKIGSDITWDLQFGYRIAYNNQAQGIKRVLAGTNWTVGAINVLNRMPPWFSSGFYSRYSDPRMRYVYLEVKKSL